MDLNDWNEKSQVARSLVLQAALWALRIGTDRWNLDLYPLAPGYMVSLGVDEDLIIQQFAHPVGCTRKLCAQIWMNACLSEMARG